MKINRIAPQILFLALLLGWPLSTSASDRLYPDLQTVVPKHLAIQNANRRELLRFTNGIANRGSGPWKLRAESQGDVTTGVQEILDEDGNVVKEEIVSTFEFHPEHNHWHIDNVALYEVRKATDDGTGGNWGGVVVNDLGEAQALKTTFCLIDWYKLDDNSPNKERTYLECGATYQGVSPGWVDQYHHPLEGQEIDITGAPEQIYYLVSTVNPDGNFLEDLNKSKNNTAWVSFRLVRDNKGNPKITEIAHSPCDTPGMCGEQATNR